MEFNEFISLYCKDLDRQNQRFIIEDLDNKELFSFTFSDSFGYVMDNGFANFYYVCMKGFYIKDEDIHIVLNCRG